MLLVRSWIAAAGLAVRAAWVPVQGEERDPQRFWLSVSGALRDTAAGSKLVRPLTAAPDLDGWAGRTPAPTSHRAIPSTCSSAV